MEMSAYPASKASGWKRYGQGGPKRTRSAKQETVRNYVWPINDRIRSNNVIGNVAPSTQTAGPFQSGGIIALIHTSRRHLSNHRTAPSGYHHRLRPGTTPERTSKPATPVPHLASTPANPPPHTFSLTSPTSYVLVLFVTNASTLPAAFRCLLMIEVLIECVVTGVYSGLSGSMVIQIWKRLTMIARGLSTAADRPPRLVPLSRLTPIRQQRHLAPCADEPRYKPYHLPVRHAWLVKLIPETQACADDFQALLQEPEMVAFLQARPGLNRLFRPFCRMLGIQQPCNPPSGPSRGYPPPPALPARTQPAPAPTPTAPWYQPTNVPPHSANPPSRPTIPLTNTGPGKT